MSRPICLIDTSVLCNILNVPGYQDDREEVLLRFKSLVEADAALHLPYATIIETGNHIAHHNDGRVRRRVAEQLRECVLDGLDGRAPWQVTAVDPGGLRRVISEFPDRVLENDQRNRGVSLADNTIIDEWRRQCRLHPARRVFIWSLDGHLRAYDREP